MRYYLLIIVYLIMFSGCNREDPLPLLGVEGVYLMERIEAGAIVEEGELSYENVYWFFADRTFRKARLMDGELKDGSGTFTSVPHPAGEGAAGEAYELVYTSGDELIEGCYPDREIIIQNSPSQLLHQGAQCGEPDIYYVKADFGGE